ncbi:iron transporter [Paenibacillus sp. S150]|uniref:iron transporter n=1 Tax=Paenibacillus sp. S150 TaxID=2749826 RepID=UPI001C56FCB4|nr:iron transporter [Paenibacillus sp. S150]MBW4082723.1 iron transporter [Paenibacillus sp. S150]
MKKIKNILMITGMAVAMSSLMLGCNSTGNSGNDAAASGNNTEVNAPSDEAAAFEEFPIGEEQEVEGLKVGALYLQPVDMEPMDKAGLPAAQSDFHLEADIAALEGNQTGFGIGEFIPYLTVHYQIKAKATDKVVSEGTFMPMNASDGAHYGANVKLDGAGEYVLNYVVESPEKMDYLLHTDDATGVEGRFWQEPIDLTWEFSWVPRTW